MSSKRTQLPIFTWESTLEDIVSELNWQDDGTNIVSVAARDELRRLVQGWNDLCRDPARTLDKFPEIRPYIYTGDDNSFPLRAWAMLDGSGLRLQLAPALPSDRELAHQQQAGLRRDAIEQAGRAVKTTNDWSEQVARAREVQINLIALLKQDLHFFRVGSNMRRIINRVLQDLGSTTNPLDESWKELEKDRARALFLALLLDRDREWLSNRPCDRCDRYYIKNRLGQKKYCSKECARDAKNNTAKTLTVKQRKRRHKKQLLVVARLARKWSTSRTKRDWKHWVSEYAEARRAGITPKFLTRAVNKGEVAEPKKGER